MTNLLDVFLRGRFLRAACAVMAISIIVISSGCERSEPPAAPSTPALSDSDNVPWQPIAYQYNDHLLMSQFADELSEPEKTAVLRIIDAVNAGEPSVDIPEAADYDQFLNIWYTYTRSYPERALVESVDFSDGVLTFTYLKSHEEHLLRISDWRETVARVIIENVAADYTDTQAAFAIYKYLVLNTEYAYEALDDPNMMNDMSGLDLLLDGRGICNDYAQVFGFIMRQLGIECLEVEDATHAWNLINLDGSWYHVDATFENGYYCTERERVLELGASASDEERSYAIGECFGMSDEARRVSLDTEWHISIGQDYERRKPAPECPESLFMFEFVLF